MVNRYYASTATETALTGGITNSATSLTVASVSGWPTQTPFTAVIDVDTSSEEIVTVTAVGGTTFTVTRGEDGSAATSHSTGATVRHQLTARDLREPQEHIAASDAVHGLTGTVVGTSDTQTLTNKTLSGSANTFSAIPQSAVTDLTTDLGDHETRVAAIEADYTTSTDLSDGLATKAALSHTHAASAIASGTLDAARIPTLDTSKIDSTGDLTVARLRLTATDDASDSSTLHALQIGPTAGVNLVLDGNEIKSRNNGVASKVYFEDGINIGATPTADSDAARKDYVDSAVAGIATTDLTDWPGSSVTASADKVVLFSPGGRLYANSPSVSDNVATKGYTDALIAQSGGSAHADGVTDAAYARSVGASYYAMYMDGNRDIGRNVSSLRYKDEITDAAADGLGVEALLDAVLALAPKTYVRKSDPSKHRDLGLIAEEVEQVAPWLVVHEDGRPETVAYETTLVVALVGAVKALAARVDELENR